MSRRSPISDAEVLAAVRSLEAAGQVPTCRAVHHRVGGSMSTVTEALRRLHLNHRVGGSLGFHSLLLASYARRVEQVDALYDALLAAHAALAGAGLAVPPIPACLGGAVLGSATWMMPGADSATPDGFVVLAESGEVPESAALEPVGRVPSIKPASVVQSTQVLGASECNHEHSTCDAQVARDTLDPGAARGAPRRGPTARHTGTQGGRP